MTETANKNKPNLYKKLLDIMAEADRIEKDGHNVHFNYDFVSESHTVEVLRNLFVKHGIEPLPSVLFAWQESREMQTKDGMRTDLHSYVFMQYRFVDVETGEETTTQWIGEGVDSQDKGFYKAMTGAQKYCLLKTLMVPTGDDPEKDSGKVQPEPSMVGAEKPKFINEKQVKLLNVWFGIAGVSEEWKEALKSRNNIKHFSELNKGQMDKIKNVLIKDGRLESREEIDDDGKKHTVFYNPKDEESPEEQRDALNNFEGEYGEVSDL